jgi:hypothetical protein
VGLRSWVKRLEREAYADGIVIRLRDGSVRAFDNNTVWGELFLAKCALIRGKARDSEVLQAVRSATPESRRDFEAEYGPIEMEVRVIASPANGGWVEVRTLTEDGRYVEVRHEGGSPEAERMRREAVQSPTRTF